MKDTIAAISTPRGFGGIGVIRISGDSSLKIAQSIFSAKIENPGTIYTGFLFDPDTEEKIDSCVVLFFKSPHSYTGDDIVELQMHGGIKNLELVLKLVIARGARIAERGEFTKRAFLNGRMDLIEASSVIDLIEAKTDKALKIASERLFGALSERINIFKNKVLEILSGIESSIDFPFDVAPTTDMELSTNITDLIKEVQDYISSYKTGKRINEEAKIVIAGKPNVGKSTLLNVLLKFDRAIVSELPGTTRDTVEEVIDFFGVPVRLIDTAGLRDSGNEIEIKGRKRALDALNNSDLVLFVFDASEALSPEDLRLAELTKGKDRIIIVNKTDLPVKLDTLGLKDIFKDERILEISALKKQRITELEEKILGYILPLNLESVLVTSEREKQIFEGVLSSLQQSLKLIGKNSNELIAEELRVIISELGNLTGERVNFDILDSIFSRFCIGK
jgi:tRNA modification GTPase